jgi:hypothetical protein
MAGAYTDRTVNPASSIIREPPRWWNCLLILGQWPTPSVLVHCTKDRRDVIASQRYPVWTE